LNEAGQSLNTAAQVRKSAPWKVEIAARVRRETGAAIVLGAKGVRPIFVDFWFDSDLGLEIFCLWRENFGSNFLTRFIMC
jgi:hypothetical protein